MAEQIANAQSDLDRIITTFRRSGDDGLASIAESQLLALNRLNRRIEHASPASLPALRAELVAMVAATQLSAPVGAASARQVELKEATEVARLQVTGFMHDYYERKIFDPWLRFASPEDEEAFRKREAERHQAIQQAHSEQTPQGDLRALTLAIDQTKDAGAHGAEKSPEYATQLHGLESKAAELTKVLGPTSRQSSIADPLDQAAPVKVDPTILAGLKSIAAADPAGEGHGVAATAMRQSTLQVG